MYKFTSISTSIASDEEQELLRAMQERCDPNWSMELRHCIPLLLRVMNDYDNAEPEQLAQTIRKMLLECRYVNDGESVSLHNDEAVEVQVQVLVDSIKYLQNAHHKDGKIRNVPVTPLMCG